MKQQGFTLIELIIAITISLFLLILLSDAFFSLRKAIEDREELTNGEAQALQVMYYLNQHVPYAGFIGCFNLNRNGAVTNHLAAEQGNVTASSVLSKDQHVLVIKLVESPILFAEPMTNNSEIIVNQLSNLQKDDVVVISDCSSAEVDKIESIRKIINKASYKITLTRALSRSYKPYATIAVLRRYRYFLKLVSYDKQLSALFVEDDKATQELVGNVYDLGFQYLPTSQQTKAIVVSFMIKDTQHSMESRWQFVIPLLEQL